ncbi:hypothetical protein SAMN04487768_0324 [Burkholderia sp. b13]|nr:hypothetical protein SAMN04487768_0324 [Burkholderia sp. b13]
MLNSNRCVQARRVAGSLAAALVCVALAPLAVANNVIVLNSGKATLSLIDQASRQVVGTVPTDKESHHLMPTLDNMSLIVANSVFNNLMFVDPKSGKVQRWVEGIEDPYQIDFSPDRKGFVSTGLRLDRLDDSRTASVTLQVSGRLMSPTSHTARIAPPWPTPRLCQ